HLSHVDGTLVVGNHHCSEVAVGITARENAHVPVHAFHGLGRQCAKGSSVSGTNCGIMLMSHLSIRHRHHEKSQKKPNHYFLLLHFASRLNVSSLRCRYLSGVGGRPDSARTSRKRALVPSRPGSFTLSPSQIPD